MHMDTIKHIRDTLSKLLGSGRVEAAVGYEEGTVPLAARPVIIRLAEDAGKLVLEPFRSGGTALYVRRYLVERRGQRDFDPEKAGKLAVVARPCDIKAMINHIKEKQYAREDIYIIGVHCPGVVDRGKIFQHLGPYDIAEAAVKDNVPVLKSRTGKKVEVPRDDALADVCARCLQRAPHDADETVGKEVPAPDTDPFAVVAAHEKKTVDERWQWFETQMNRCIRCRACRQACPMCYCNTCFADQTNPAWIGQTAADPDVQGFHIGRLMHMAGRCVDCGLCETACPMNIPLTLLNRKLDQVIYDLFGYQSGMNPEEVPPLSTYNPDDPNKGFM